MTASGAFEATGTGYEPRGAFTLDGVAIDPAAYPALRAIALAALCSATTPRCARREPDWIVDGDPMEGALIALAIKAGVDAEAARRDFPRLKEIPFDARHRFMATLNRVGADSLITVKGAPERVLELCAPPALGVRRRTARRADVARRDRQARGPRPARHRLRLEAARA